MFAQWKFILEKPEKLKMHKNINEIIDQGQRNQMKLKTR